MAPIHYAALVFQTRPGDNDSCVPPCRIRGHGRRSPLDISLEFLLSPEGSFFRSAVLSDITSTAIFSLSRKLLRRPRIRDTERSLRTDVLLRTDDDSRREPSSEGDDARRIEAPTGREASREALTRRLAGGARRRPILALRMCAAVVVASVRAAGLVSTRISIRRIEKRNTVKWLRITP